MKCLNVIVLYDNAKEVRKYIKETNDISCGMVDIVLVVNKDTENESDRILMEFQDCIRIINYNENVGYLNALLKTIKNGALSCYDYYILSNTDITYAQKDFFIILDGSKYKKDVGCIAPSIFSTKIKNYQNPHYKERITKSKFERIDKVFHYPILARLYLVLSSLKSRNKKLEKQESCYVYSPNGAYMIFTEDFIKKIKGYEYGVKLYSEESCIGELLLRNNMKCYYDSTIEVIHQESTVTGKIDYRERFRAWRDSIEYILREFY